MSIRGTIPLKRGPYIHKSQSNLSSVYLRPHSARSATTAPLTRAESFSSGCSGLGPGLLSGAARGSSGWSVTSWMQRLARIAISRYLRVCVGGG